METITKKKKNNIYLNRKVIRLCSHPDINVCKEAGWCLSNAVCSSTLPQLMLLVDNGFIEAMISLLHTDAETVVSMAISTLKFCLVSYNRLTGQEDFAFNSLVYKMEEANGLDALERIQANEKFSYDCYQSATEFVFHFWPDDYDAKTDKDNEENNEDEIDFGMEDASTDNSYQF
ncbi:hypothetical protein RFI_31968 [Reticulomyxa filosa]|uniref:Uncharacterized protein n=1 Tax=Reticulomyxa filosa TaxID=46433 RepID=X6LU49_RETFI|nr:hypothetical protein RFI_31968 [Reticulomyxa filosa]|eukprot:ETO05428.1 hypothetical protein RFI_31968 [Reticulomyxa filosa]